MKDYRFLGEEVEVLGQRLDAARDALSRSKKNSWAQKYWQQCIKRLTFQWQQLPILHDGDAKMTIVPRWNITYDFFEKAEGPGYGITNRVFDELFNHTYELDSSWHRHREARLARAQY
jgi:hypothetical protein